MPKARSAFNLGPGKRPPCSPTFFQARAGRLRHAAGSAFASFPCTRAWAPWRTASPACGRCTLVVAIRARLRILLTSEPAATAPGRRQALPASCPSRSPPRPREQFRHFPLKRLWSRAFLNRRVLQNADSLRKVFLITLGNIAAALPVPAHAAAFLLPQCLPTRIFRPGLFSKFRPAPQTAVSELGKLSGTLYSSLRRTNVHQSVFSSLPLALSSDPPSLFLVIEDYV